MVINHVDKKYNTIYSASAMRELFYRMGFSSKKPHIIFKRGGLYATPTVFLNNTVIIKHVI